jgi:hypothetical protein
LKGILWDFWGVIYMKDKLLEQIATYIVVAVLTFFGNVAINYLVADKGTVKIGTVIELEKGIFELPIDIYNFSDKNIDNLKIKVPDNIDVDKVKSTQVLNIIKITNNIQNEGSSVFQINSIGEQQKIHLAFLFNKNIEHKEVEVFKNGNEIKIEYPEDIKAPLESQLQLILLSSIIYTVIIGSMNFLTDRRNNRRMKENSDKFESYKQQSDTLLEQISESVKLTEKNNSYLQNTNDNLEKRINKMEQRYKQREIMLLSRIKDYSTELNFWRDTIRAILYKSKDQKCEPKDIADAVTNMLKTYQTLEYKQVEYDTVKVLSGLLKDKIET